jgi:Ran GTPase-activating protein (RanGAP) involved in mRNA processing and transport
LDRARQIFESALRATTTLTVWDMSFNDLGDDGVGCIARALAANAECPLRVLDLTYNNFRSDGARALAEYVASSSTLIELSVRNNELGEAGCASVGKILTSSTLVKLDLSGTRLATSGLHSVAAALRTNTRLTSLSLHDLEDDGLRVIGVALHANASSALCHATCDAFDASGDGTGR